MVTGEFLATLDDKEIVAVYVPWLNEELRIDTVSDVGAVVPTNPKLNQSVAPSP
jgi:hypothetical protein